MTATVTVVSPAGSTEDTATVELPAEIFEAKVNVPLIHQVVVAQQAAARQGTHATKTRGNVRGGGKKPYRQKGTGRARQGSIRAPQFAGGGTVHGPVPRSYEQRTPKKMKTAALRGRVHVVSRFVDGDEPRTKDALSVLSAACGVPPSAAPVLVVADANDVTTWKSLRNVPGVHLIASGQLNTYDVLVSDHVVFTESALAAFTGRTGDRPAVETLVAGEPSADAEPAAAQDAGAEPAEAEETEAEETEASEPEDAES